MNFVPQLSQNNSNNIVVGVLVASLIGYAFFVMTRKDEGGSEQPFIFDEKLLDKIDKDFVEALRALPDGGNILDENKKLKLENVLGLLKQIYIHMREREYDNYKNCMVKRLKNLTSDINTEYTVIITEMVKANRAQEMKTKDLAVQILNLNPNVKLILSSKTLDKFIEVCEKNDPDNFKVYHEMIRAGIAGGKPKYFVKFDDLPKDKASQAFEMREKLI